MIKVILSTASATIAAIIIAGTLFLNTFLALFGLATMPLEIYQGLQGADKVVETMKVRNRERKRNLKKKFVKQSGRRVAATAIAASTIGTA